MNNIRKLKADEIECRVAQVGAKGCSLLLYKTARVDRSILDEAHKDLWQNDFKVIDGKMYGGIGIYQKDLHEWIWRWDCGTESNTEAEKGQASDCFKRAGFKWGIGIELYSAPFIWANIEIEKNDKGKYQLRDKFKKFYVSSIGYAENGNINSLVIDDEKGNQIYSMKTKEKKKEPERINKIDDTDIYKKLIEINDINIYEALPNLNTVNELNKYWLSNRDKVQDKEQFKTLCASRKEVIIAG